MPEAKKTKKKVTSAKDWKSKSSEGIELEVPSGNTALVRAPGMDVFMKRGFIPNGLMPFIQEAIEKGKPPKMKDFKVTEEALAEMTQLMDDVTIYCVIEPRLTPIPLDDEGRPLPDHERDEECLYIDQVDMEDKSFIFQFAIGGTKDIERFRKGLAAGVGPVQPIEDVELPAESASSDTE